jgi:predicted protein tyrosine phosphatase
MPEIQIRSKGAASNFEYPTPWAAISISTEVDQWPVLSEINRVDLLQIHFMDIDAPNKGGLTTEHASQILQFVEKNWDVIDCLLVHCEMGVSRSPGVGAAISKIKTGEDAVFFKRYTPNRFVYKSILLEAIEQGLYDPF